MSAPRSVLIRSLVVVGLLGILLPTSALAHNLSGHYTSTDGCEFDWVDFDSLGAHAADIDETNGNSCDSVQAKIRVLESGAWVTRQDTDASHAYVAGVGASDMDWVDHNWSNPVWKGFRKDH